MTEREVCERIVRDGHCAGVGCSVCPLFDGEWDCDCDCMDEVTLAEMWLRLHPCEKKLVFSREKYLGTMDEVDPDGAERRREFDWPFECDGKTEEECNALGYAINGNWMEEKEMGYKEKQEQWLKANNLEEGSRVYVYRKPEDHENGRACMWIDSLNGEMVGKVASIVEVTSCSLGVKVGDKTYFMPYTALLPVGVTEFEVGRRYKYVGAGGAQAFKDLCIDEVDAKVLGSGCELMVAEVIVVL